MSEIEQLKKDLEDLRQIVFQSHLPNDQIVGADYVAVLFGCSATSVVRGRFGTNKIRRVRSSPLGFRKADVHAVLREITRSPKEIAAEISANAKTRKRRNI